MGRIIKFPIKIKTDFATEMNFGITPMLRASVRSIASASTSEVPSEKADRLAINGLTLTFNGNNPSSGEYMYVGDSTTDNIITVDFMTLIGQESIVTYDDIYYVNIGTNQPGIPNSVPVVITKKTVNGGILQKNILINYHNFNSLSNSIDILTLKSGMCIGKILIRCTTPFNNNTTQYSIGIDSNEQRFIKNFNAPIAKGPVDIIYGTYMEDKVEYVSSALTVSAPLRDGIILRIYRTGTENTSGQMQVVIFYDQI